MATKEKLLLEDNQRSVYREMKEKSEEWIPKLFEVDPVADNPIGWVYKYREWVYLFCSGVLFRRFFRRFVQPFYSNFNHLKIVRESIFKPLLAASQPPFTNIVWSECAGVKGLNFYWFFSACVLGIWALTVCSMNTKVSSRQWHVTWLPLSSEVRVYHALPCQRTADLLLCLLATGCQGLLSLVIQNMVRRRSWIMLESLTGASPFFAVLSFFNLLIVVWVALKGRLLFLTGFHAPREVIAAV